MAGKEWFETWFSSPDYLELYKHRDDTDAHKLVALLGKSVVLPENARVLDLACGNGRHSAAFAAKGYMTTGVDLSAYLVGEANRLKRTRYRNHVSKLRFERGDMRKLKYNSEFDVVANLFSSFGYFEKDSENLKVIKSISRALVCGGYFFFDFFNAAYLEKNLVPFDFKKSKERYIIQSRHIEDGKCVKDILIFSAVKGKTHYVPHHFRESLKMYTADYLMNMIDKCGLHVVKRFGDYDGSRFNKNKSERFIVIAGKY